MVCPRGTQPWREAETQRTIVPVVLAVNIPALLGQERGEGAADVLGVGQGQGARWAGGMGSSQEMLGACLSCRKGGIEACEGGHGAWLWRGWQVKPVQVIGDEEPCEGGWRECVAQATESAGENFGAHPDQRPREHCWLGHDQTLAV